MGETYAQGDEIDWAALLAHLPPSTYRRVRNAFDRVAGACLLLIVSPVIFAIALAILLDTGGPIFFLQCRAGRFARPFMILKFRTMSTRAPESSLKVAPDNPCITKVGRILRRSGLDELPNLWNVVRGDMALIGPRPEQFALLGYYERWHHLRHLVKPGITGWWQIHHRDSEPMHLNVERDIYYVCNQSPALDLRIIVGTLKVAISAVGGQNHTEAPASGQTFPVPDFAAADAAGHVDKRSLVVPVDASTRP
jgi:lipopolysaccharide/colanic/teichoic acid biosynthesis glycosyltransferase